MAPRVPIVGLSNLLVSCHERSRMSVLQTRPSLSLYRRALDLQTRYRYGFYDSLVIAAALDAGCTRLYSEDLQDGQRIEGLTIKNPFLEL